MLRKVQYVWKDHTMIRCKSWERVSVEENEIIEVEVEREIDLKYYTLNWFKVVLSEEEEDAIKEEEKKAKARAKAKADDVEKVSAEVDVDPIDPEASVDLIDPEDDIEALKIEAAELWIVVKWTRWIKALKKAIEEAKANGEEDEEVKD